MNLAPPRSSFLGPRKLEVGSRKQLQHTHPKPKQQKKITGHQHQHQHPAFEPRATSERARVPAHVPVHLPPAGLYHSPLPKAPAIRDTRHATATITGATGRENENSQARQEKKKTKRRNDQSWRFFFIICPFSARGRGRRAPCRRGRRTCPSPRRSAPSSVAFFAAAAAATCPPPRRPAARSGGCAPSRRCSG